MLEKFIRELPQELQEKARKCGSTEELLALARDEKVELPPEALEAIAGGKGGGVGCSPFEWCPRCGGKNYTESREDLDLNHYRIHYRCKDCGCKWYRDYVYE